MKEDPVLPGPVQGVTGTPWDRAWRFFQLPELWRGQLLMETKIKLVITQINL